MSENSHDLLLEHVNTYADENEKFTAKGNKAAGTRARKALMAITKLCKDRRKEIQDTKKSN